MKRYTIEHKAGEYKVEVESSNGNHMARISDQDQLSIVLVATNEHDLYDNCRSWASSNIRGEFSFQNFEGGSNESILTPAA